MSEYNVYAVRKLNGRYLSSLKIYFKLLLWLLW